MNLDTLILVAAGVMLVSAFVPFDKVLGYLKERLSKVKRVDGSTEDDEEEMEFCLVDAVEKFVELRDCLEAGEREAALEKLDEVFLLLNGE